MSNWAGDEARWAQAGRSNDVSSHATPKRRRQEGVGRHTLVMKLLVTQRLTTASSMTTPTTYSLRPCQAAWTDLAPDRSWVMLDAGGEVRLSGEEESSGVEAVGGGDGERTDMRRLGESWDERRKLR